jgi:hypothetical protein
MESTVAYFKWTWVQDGEMVKESTNTFSQKTDCFNDALENIPDTDEPVMRITAYNANGMVLREKKVYGSFELGHGIRLQPLSYNGKPRIDIRKWQKREKSEYLLMMMMRT